ncbi:MAG: hypothetical protein JWQ38_2123 [Flavipsychrobacter sp.]|nr:hypothetical protein [Flavipsychrobacter sp.]
MTHHYLLPDVLIALGKKLRILRHLKDDKLDTVAAATKISKSTLSKIENGTYSSLCIEMLIALANYYNTHPALLLTFEQ